MEKLTYDTILLPLDRIRDPVQDSQMMSYSGIHSTVHTFSTTCGKAFLGIGSAFFLFLTLRYHKHLIINMTASYIMIADHNKPWVG